MANKRRGRGEGSIRQRNNGSWEYRYYDGRDPKTGKARRVSVYFDTYTELLAEKRKIDIRLETTGRAAVPSSMTLSAWLDEWLDIHTPNLTDGTKSRYKSAIEHHIKPELGQARLKELRLKDIQIFVNDLSKELSPKTVRNYYGVLHKALKKAVEVDYIRSNPAEGVELPKNAKPEIKPLPENNVAEFLGAIEEDFYKNALIVALFTGLRQTEVVGLTWDNIDFEHGLITVNKKLARDSESKQYEFTPTKNKKARQVPMIPTVAAALQEEMSRQKEWESLGAHRNDDNLVFTNVDGCHISADTMYKHFKKAVKAIGLPELRFHDLRHSYAVLCLRSDVDLKTISESMGHYSAAYTMDRYQHVTEAMQEDAREKLEKFVSSCTPGKPAK